MNRAGLFILACLSPSACVFDTSNLYQQELNPGISDGSPDSLGDSGIAPIDAPLGTPDANNNDAAEPPVDPCDESLTELVLCMQFEDTASATTLLDESQYSNNATVSNATFGAGQDGQALQTDGTFDSVISKSASLDTTDELTIEMWINPDRDVSDARWGLFDNNGQYGFFLANGNRLRCSTSGGPNVTTAGAVIAPLQWQHVACVYDGNSILLYVNGTEVASANGSGQMATNGTDGSTLAQNSPDGDEYHGRLDTLRVWNLARSRAELCAGANLACP